MTRPLLSLLLCASLVILLLLTCTAGCTVELQVPDVTLPDLPEMTPPFAIGHVPVDTPRIHEPPVPETPYGTDGTVRVGAFNIQVFGVMKAGKPEVMEILGRIIRTYDLIGIQEVRDSTGTALPALLEVVNARGSNFTYIESERLGRTISKEQYAFFYNMDAISLTANGTTYPEPEGTDPFHREPFIASFSVNDGDFDAVFILIHTDPDEAGEEIDALGDVVEYASWTYPDEEDVIIMGDLNADGSYFNESGWSRMKGEEYTWLITNEVDTTTKSTNVTYDRIIITSSLLSDYAGEAGIFSFDSEYGLNQTMTEQVSDHYPVYAIFRMERDED